MIAYTLLAVGEFLLLSLILGAYRELHLVRSQRELGSQVGSLHAGAAVPAEIQSALSELLGRDRRTLVVVSEGCAGCRRLLASLARRGSQSQPIALAAIGSERFASMVRALVRPETPILEGVSAVAMAGKLGVSVTPTTIEFDRKIGRMVSVSSSTEV